MVGTCLLALCVTAGSAQARKALQCAGPAEVAAMQTAAIQQELMDAALTCGDQARTDFNAFQTSFNAELRRSDKTLLSMFRRVMGGSKGDAAYNLFKTNMASKAELRRVHGHADFCAAANLVISAALAPDKPSLNDFVAGVPVTDVPASEENPVGSCQLQVAVTLQGAMVSPAVLPRPNPLRVAVAEQPAAPAPTAPGNASAEPSAAAPPAVEPPKEEPKKPESKGWLSSIF
jgi:hypothetical protein